MFFVLSRLYVRLWHALVGLMPLFVILCGGLLIYLVFYFDPKVWAIPTMTSQSFDWYKNILILTTALFSYLFVQTHLSYTRCKENSQKLLEQIQGNEELKKDYALFLQFFEAAEALNLNDQDCYNQLISNNLSLSLSRIVNVFEIIAIQSQSGIIDEDYMYSFYGGMLVIDIGPRFVRVLPFINNRARIDYWNNAVNLYEHWALRYKIDKWVCRNLPFFSSFRQP